MNTAARKSESLIVYLVFPLDNQMLSSGWVFRPDVSKLAKELLSRFNSVKTDLKLRIYLLLFPKAGVGYNVWSGV